MLHKDYLVEEITQFVEAVMEGLGLARVSQDPQATLEVENAVAGLLDLDPEVALMLTPDSLVTMMLLSGVGDALADYVTYALREVADIYEAQGDVQTADLRREQARVVAASFGCDYDVIPEEFLSYNVPSTTA
ncbi:MAG: hypothetical protein Q4G41_03615 [Coriobacteriales bacterium]|nr:hypothetical protein [Coriobacteriales bacterium]